MYCRTAFFCILPFCLFLMLPVAGFAEISRPLALESTLPAPFTAHDFSKTKVEDLLGRKLTLGEKLALPLIKKKLAKGVSAAGAVRQGNTDGMAIAGFVTGLVSIFIFGIILGILGIVFSSLALKRIKREPDTRSGKGLAIAGLILGLVGVIGALIFVLIAVSG